MKVLKKGLQSKKLLRRGVVDLGYISVSLFIAKSDYLYLIFK